MRSRSTVEIPTVGHSILNHGWTELDMSNLIDSNVDLFMYLIEGIRFGT